MCCDSSHWFSDTTSGPSLYLHTVYLLKPASYHTNVTPNLHKVSSQFCFSQYVSICTLLPPKCILTSYACVWVRKRKVASTWKQFMRGPMWAGATRTHSNINTHTQTYTVWLQPQINDQEWFHLSKSHSREQCQRKPCLLMLPKYKSKKGNLLLYGPKIVVEIATFIALFIVKSIDFHCGRYEKQTIFQACPPPYYKLKQWDVTV